MGFFDERNAALLCLAELNESHVWPQRIDGLFVHDVSET
jgi:hypothetical protein